jgi:hypothetical protein
MNTDNLLSNSLLIGKSIKSFREKDPFRTYRWKSSTNPTELTQTESFYSLRTNVRISRFLECKKLELFLQGLSDLETQALYDVPEVLGDPLFVNLLRAKLNLLQADDWQNRQPLLLGRVQILRSGLGLSQWNENLLYAYLGNLKYELILTPRRIRPFKKYSGYVKTPSAAGSKRKSGSVEEKWSEIFDQTKFEERDLVPFLLSPTEDYDLLGFSAESPLYKPLVKLLQERKEIPNGFKKLILFRPI